MSRSLSGWLPLLCCPVHRTSLDLNAAGDCLTCSEGDHLYPVSYGIPQFLNLEVSSDPDSEVKRQEIAFRDSVAEDHWNEWSHASLKNRLEIPPCLQAMSPAVSDVVVELGCGTGRLTLQYLPRVDRVIAMDFSLASLISLQNRIPAELRDRILLVHGDICAPPLATKKFSKAVSFQVLEHLPSRESRQLALRQAAELLQPGGSLVCTVYNWSEEKKLDARRGVGDNTQKEGFHDTGVFYFNFEEHDLRQLFAAGGLEMDLLAGIRIPIRGGRLLGPLVVPLNRLLARTRFGLRRGHLLLGRGRTAS